MCVTVVATCCCKGTNGMTHIHTQRDTQTIKSVTSSDDPRVPSSRRAVLLCAEPGCNSVLCLRAAVKATKLIRLPSGGRDDSLMTLVHTHTHTLSMHTLMCKCRKLHIHDDTETAHFSLGRFFTLFWYKHAHLSHQVWSLSLQENGKMPALLFIDVMIGSRGNQRQMELFFSISASRVLRKYTCLQPGLCAKKERSNL